jgi:hypothetical protein
VYTKLSHFAEKLKLDGVGGVGGSFSVLDTPHHIFFLGFFLVTLLALRSCSFCVTIFIPLLYLCFLNNLRRVESANAANYSEQAGGTAQQLVSARVLAPRHFRRHRRSSGNHNNPQIFINTYFGNF